LAQEASRPSGRAESPEDQGEAESPEVVTRLAVLTQRFGERLSEEQWAKVRERVGKTIEFGEKLRAVPLTNADEPEIVFAPYRGEGR
jgi:hypothetical protein